MNAKSIDANQARNDGATPLIIATYLGNSSTVKLLLSLDGIDVSAKCNGKTAVYYATANRRVASWGSLDDKVNDEGRIECQILFQNFNKLIE